MNKLKEWKLLLQCYRSGQMSEKQLQAEFDDDPEFKAWFEKQG